MAFLKQGLKTWHNLTSCTICSSGHDQEAILLSLVSIRSVTRYLQRLAPRYTPCPPTDPSTSNHKDNTNSVPFEEPCRLMVGSLEIEDEERIHVYRMLYRKAIQRVRHVLQSLEMLQSQKKKILLEQTVGRTAGLDDYHASSGLSHTQQITHALATGLEELESSLTTE